MKIRRKIVLALALALLVSLCAIVLWGCKNRTCEHTFGEWSESVAATCTAEGTRMRTCSLCGETESESLAIVAHTFSRYLTNHDATCLTNMTETAKCEGCNATDTREVADSKDMSVHATAAVKYQKHATDANLHDKLHACCGALVETEAHVWDSGKPDGEVTVYTCTFCEFTYRQAPAGHEHDAAHVAAVAANCTEYGNVEYWYCEGCNTYFADEALTRQLIEDETKIAPTHTSTAYTYVDLADGRHQKKHACCGTLVETVAHEFAFYRTVAPACDQQGGTEYRCECGKTRIEVTAEATGHSVESWRFVSESLKSGTTCTYSQTYCGECFVCGETQTKASEAEKHSFVATITAHPTCVSAGSKHYECSVCHAEPTMATIAIPVTATAHNWNNGVTSGGVTTYTCQTCTATKTALVYSGTSRDVSTDALANNDLVLDGISLRLDRGTLSLLAPDQDVSISASPVTNRDALVASLPEALRVQITANTPIYDFSLSQNGQSISDFGGGVITITIPYTLPVGVDADCVAVWYVKPNGELDFYRATYCEVGEQGFLTFDAEHFSTYLPGIAPSEDACELYGHNELEIVVKPTCSNRGYTEYHCQRCGVSRIGNVISALGHTYDMGTPETQATCSTPGTTVYACTQEGCDHTLSVSTYAPHNYQYDAASSKAVSCTEDGCTVYKCSANGCQAERREMLKSSGTHDMRVHGMALASGVSSCTDGVVVTYKCYNDFGAGCCTHTETETLFGAHISQGKFAYGEDGTLLPEEVTIGLGSYLTSHGIDYTEEAVIVLVHGCFCGEQKGEIYMTCGSRGGENLFNSGGEFFFKADEAPQKESDCDTYVFETASQMGWTPETGPYELPTFKVQFKELLAVDGCHRIYSLEIKIGYDSQTGSALRTETYVLSEFDAHLSTKTTASVDDPSKSCYENCFDANKKFYDGITLITSCNDCDTVIETRTTSVNTSSKHEWYVTETYDYRPTGCPEGNYGLRVAIKECPCGKKDYTVTANRNQCSFSLTKTLEDGTKVYTCTKAGCGYVYAEREVILQDADNCRYTVTKYLWIGCASANDVQSCDKAYVCVKVDEAWHANRTTETNQSNPTPTENPCWYYVYSKTVCSCGHVYSSSESYRAIHDYVESTVTDADGNVTHTKTCQRQGCGCVSVTVTNKDGVTVREYSAEKDYDKGERVVSLRTWSVRGGERVETLERNERYGLESGVLLSWYQFTYAYSTHPEKGCIRKTIYTDHEGGFEATEELVCRWEYERQERTCLQDGFGRQVCTVCGHTEYTWEEPAHHMYDWSQWKETTVDGHQIVYYQCGFCYACVVNPYVEYGVNVMLSWELFEGNVSILYRNQNTAMSVIDATYALVAYATDEYGRLMVDAETREPECVTLDGVAVTDDGEGTLRFSAECVSEALKGADTNDLYGYTVCFVVTDIEGNTTYLDLSMVLSVY